MLARQHPTRPTCCWRRPAPRLPSSRGSATRRAWYWPPSALPPLRRDHRAASAAPGSPRPPAPCAGERTCSSDTGRRRPGFHGFIGQVTLDVAGQAVGCLVPPLAMLLQAFHHHPVQLAAQKPHELARLGLPQGRQRGERLIGGEPRQGFEGSSSRMMRIISVSAAFLSRLASIGRRPVSSS